MRAFAADRRLPLRAALSLAILICSLAMMQRALATAGCESRAAAAGDVVPAERLENWEPLSNRAVLIWTKDSSRAYLVGLDRALPGLGSAGVISLVDGDHDHTIAACGHDGVTIGDGARHGAMARIVAIERLSAKRTAQLDHPQAAQPGSFPV